MWQISGENENLRPNIFNGESFSEQNMDNRRNIELVIMLTDKNHDYYDCVLPETATKRRMYPL